MQHDAREVKNRILGNLEGFLSYLLPAGKVIGHEYRVGDVHGAPGKSLAVQLRGDAAGVWQDYGGAADDKGDIFDLYCKNRNVDFKTGFPELCRWLGLAAIERPKPVQKPRPDFKKDVSGMRGTKVFEYLTGRGIAPETMQAYKLRVHRRQSAHNTDFVAFQFWDTDGDPVMLKSTGINPRADGSKDIWTTPPFYTLWGWWLVREKDRAVIITEGEYDAMSVFQMQLAHMNATGDWIPVLSMPAGCKNLTWIENDYHALLRFERIYLCTDMDTNGEEAAAEIAKRLGQARCFRMRVPNYKDANKCLTDGDEVDTDVTQWLAKATTYDPPSLRGAASYGDAARRRLLRWQEEDARPNFCLPAVKFNWRKGECTLMTGVSGHGKSEFCYQSVLHDLTNGEKVLITSFEIDPDEMMLNMIQQHLGRAPKPADVENAMAWFDGKLWFYHPKEDAIKATIKPMFDDYGYAVRRFGVTKLLIDSLLFVCKKDDYEGQDLFCKTIRDFDRLNDTHTILIAHASPKKDENAVPKVSDINGSSGIIAPFSNILIVWRNVTKEDELEKARDDGDEGKVASLSRAHDGILFVAKQRHTGKRSKTKLYFNPESRTFRTTSDLPPAENTPTLF